MRRVGLCLVLAAAGALALAGCGSSGAGSTAPTTTGVPDGAASTTEPTAIVPDAAVTAGLAAVQTQAGKVEDALGTGGPETAKTESKQMYELWYGFEATVRQNDKDLYLQMEDGLADIQAGARDGKADRIERGLKDLQDGAAAYLGKHP
jgi:hypothetical protein